MIGPRMVCYLVLNDLHAERVSALDQLVVATGHAAIAATAIHNALRAQARDDAPMRGRA